MTNVGDRPTSPDPEPNRVDGREARRFWAPRPARLSRALVVLGLLGACVDLTRPSVDDRCADGRHECRSDAGGLDAGADLAPPPDLANPDQVPPGDQAPPDDVMTPVDEAADSPDGPAPDTGGPDESLPDMIVPEVGAPDLPRDLPPDLAFEVQVDAAVDRPPDVAVPDTMVPVEKGVCPTSESSLLLCLRFEGSLADESAPPANVTGSNVSYEAGPSDLAVRVVPASVIRASQGWGSVGATFTLEAWIRPDRLPTGSQRMGLLDEESRFGMFILAGGTLACYAAGTAVTVPSAVRVGQWSAVTCTASSNTLVAWVDGLQRNQGALESSPTGATSNLAIGSNNPSGDTFEGLMDNIRVWNTVRTGPQICQASLGCP